MKKLSANAQKVFSAFAGDEGESRWIRYANVRDLGPFTLAEVCAIWNELREAGLAQGSITTGEPVRVLRGA
jgi:hypothetical protein